MQQGVPQMMPGAPYAPGMDMSAGGFSPQQVAQAPQAPYTYSQPANLWPLPGQMPPVQQAAPGYGQGMPTAAPTQAAPVPPVAAPGFNPQQNAPTPQQVFTRHLQSIARLLEQCNPGYQILASMLQNAQETPYGQGTPELLDTLKAAITDQFSALGTIRRLLTGDVSPATVTDLAVSVNRLAKLHTQDRQVLERIMSTAVMNLRGPLAALTQVLPMLDTFIGQATAAVQSFVGPQIWETAQSRVFGSEPATAK